MTAEKNATETINEATGTAVDASANLLAQLAFLREVDKLKALWAEFEARETAESKFANAVDRLLPALHNLANQGGTWRTPGVHRGLINGRLQPIGEGAAAVWAYIEKLLDEAQLLEYFAPEP